MVEKSKKELGSQAYNDFFESGKESDLDAAVNAVIKYVLFQSWF